MQVQIMNKKLKILAIKYDYDKLLQLLIVSSIAKLCI